MNIESLRRIESEIHHRDRVCLCERDRGEREKERERDREKVKICNAVPLANHSSGYPLLSS